MKLGQRQLKAHRVAWCLHQGTDPGHLMVDHIDRNRSNNRASNLRLVDPKGNRANGPCPDRPVKITYPDGQTCLLPSVAAAAAALGCARSSVNRYARGLRPHPSGLLVSYA